MSEFNGRYFSPSLAHPKPSAANVNISNIS